jgi:3-hydroxyanthranilate 3,4-dioxygenase
MDRREQRKLGPAPNRLEDSDFITVVHRGPNRGKQFHINEGDEIFYQLEGELNFHYINSSDKREVLVLKPGEMFLLPANVPHSPRREEGSWTLVVERKRRPDEIDRWVWFCERCDNKLYEAAPRSGEGPSDKANFSVEDTNQRLRTDLALSTCKRCGETLKVEDWPVQRLNGLYGFHYYLRAGSGSIPAMVLKTLTTSVSRGSSATSFCWSSGMSGVG